MKIFAASVLALTSTLSSCGPIEEDRWTAMLVDRFDVPACSTAAIRHMRGEDIPAGRKVIRSYDVHEECIHELEQALVELNFKYDGTGSFQRNGGGDWMEVVTITRPKGLESGSILWEEINP